MLNDMARFLSLSLCSVCEDWETGISFQYWGSVLCEQKNTVIWIFSYSFFLPPLKSIGTYIYNYNWSSVVEENNYIVLLFVFDFFNMN